MNRIDAKFASLQGMNKKALITYITAGDGGYEMTKQAVLAMEAAGADMIELGVPFSDPIAEGTEIQKASLRALQGGTNLKGILEMVKQLREETEIPLVLMMYANTVFRNGIDAFFAACKKIGVDGVIVPDLPYEEQNEFQGAATANEVRIISLVAPSSKKRISRIAADAEGFLCVSSYDGDEVGTSALLNQVKDNSTVPFCADCGIRDGAAAARMGSLCSGVVVTGALVEKMEKLGSDAVPEIAKLVAEIRQGLNQA